LHRRGAGLARMLGPTPSGARILPHQLRLAQSVLRHPTKLQPSAAG
jgi:hypothetical protein